MLDIVRFTPYNCLKGRRDTTIKDRIFQIRSHLALTQKAFADQLGFTTNYVWMIEKGEREPSERTISDICRIFGVNEHWLRTGEGDMFRHRDRGDEIADIVSMMLRDEMSPEMEAAVVVLSRASSEQLEAVLNFCRDLLAKYDDVKEAKAKKDAPD